jgi:hypothetical protein
MIESAKNKAINPAERVTVTAKSQIVNEYHFAGTPDYEPLSVTANTIEEATAIWEQKRVALAAVAANEQKAEPEGKVEEVKTDDQN